MDIVDLAALIATWAAFSEGGSIALEALAILRVTGDQYDAASVGDVLPLIEEHQLFWNAAVTTSQNRLALGQESDDCFRIGRVLVMLGDLAFGQDDLRRARSAGVEALSIFRSMGNRRWEGLSLWYLAMFDGSERKLLEAALGYRESLLAFLEQQNLAFAYKPIIGLASIGAEIECPEAAASLIGSADTQLHHFAGRLFPFDRAVHERAELLARRNLGDARFAAAHRRGQNLDMTDWMRLSDELVMACEEWSARTSKPCLRSGGVLTAREKEVLCLLAEGRSNPEIADQLFVGVGTAKTHVAHILAKLDVTTRAAAATCAIRQGLI